MVCSANVYALDFSMHCWKESALIDGPYVTVELKKDSGEISAPTFTLTRVIETFGRPDGKMFRSETKLGEGLSCENYFTKRETDSSLVLSCKKGNVTLQMNETAKGKFALSRETLDAAGRPVSQVLNDGFECSAKLQ